MNNLKRFKWLSVLIILCFVLEQPMLVNSYAKSRKSTSMDSFGMLAGAIIFSKAPASNQSLMRAGLNYLAATQSPKVFKSLGLNQSWQNIGGAALAGAVIGGMNSVNPGQTRFRDMVNPYNWKGSAVLMDTAKWATAGAIQHYGYQKNWDDKIFNGATMLASKIGATGVEMGLSKYGNLGGWAISADHKNIQWLKGNDYNNHVSSIKAGENNPYSASSKFGSLALEGVSLASADLAGRHLGLEKCPEYSMTVGTAMSEMSSNILSGKGFRGMLRPVGTAVLSGVSNLALQQVTQDMGNLGPYAGAMVNLGVTSAIRARLAGGGYELGKQMFMAGAEQAKGSLLTGGIGTLGTDGNIYYNATPDASYAAEMIDFSRAANKQTSSAGRYNAANGGAGVVNAIVNKYFNNLNSQANNNIIGMINDRLDKVKYVKQGDGTYVKQRENNGITEWAPLWNPNAFTTKEYKIQPKGMEKTMPEASKNDFTTIKVALAKVGGSEQYPRIASADKSFVSVSDNDSNQPKVSSVDKDFFVYPAGTSSEVILADHPNSAIIGDRETGQLYVYPQVEDKSGRRRIPGVNDSVAQRELEGVKPEAIINQGVVQEPKVITNIAPELPNAPAHIEAGGFYNAVIEGSNDEIRVQAKSVEEDSNTYAKKIEVVLPDGKTEIVEVPYDKIKDPLTLSSRSRNVKEFLNTNRSPSKSESVKPSVKNSIKTPVDSLFSSEPQGSYSYETGVDSGTYSPMAQEFKNPDWIRPDNDPFKEAPKELRGAADKVDFEQTNDYELDIASREIDKLPPEKGEKIYNITPEPENSFRNVKPDENRYYNLSVKNYQEGKEEIIPVKVKSNKIDEFSRRTVNVELPNGQIMDITVPDDEKGKEGLNVDRFGPVNKYLKESQSIQYSRTNTPEESWKPTVPVNPYDHPVAGPKPDGYIGGESQLILGDKAKFVPKNKTTPNIALESSGECYYVTGSNGYRREISSSLYNSLSAAYPKQVIDSTSTAAPAVSSSRSLVPAKSDTRKQYEFVESIIKGDTIVSTEADIDKRQYSDKHISCGENIVPVVSAFIADAKASKYLAHDIDIGKAEIELDKQEYGPACKEIVKAFQRANGITPDGSIGKNTISMLFGGTSPKQMIRSGKTGNMKTGKIAPAVSSVKLEEQRPSVFKQDVKQIFPDNILKNELGPLDVSALKNSPKESALKVMGYRNKPIGELKEIMPDLPTNLYGEIKDIVRLPGQDVTVVKADTHKARNNVEIFTLDKTGKIIDKYEVNESRSFIDWSGWTPKEPAIKIIDKKVGMQANAYALPTVDLTTGKISKNKPSISNNLSSSPVVAPKQTNKQRSQAEEAYREFYRKSPVSVINNGNALLENLKVIDSTKLIKEKEIK